MSVHFDISPVIPAIIERKEQAKVDEKAKEIDYKGIWTKTHDLINEFPMFKGL